MGLSEREPKTSKNDMFGLQTRRARYVQIALWTWFSFLARTSVTIAS